MSTHLSLQQKLSSYYKATDQNELAQLQETSNTLTESFHPIAILKYNPNGTASSQELEVQFFRTPTGSVSANVYARFNDVIKRALLATVTEENIIHGGYIYDTPVSSMGKSEKDAFIESLAKRNIYKINDNIYLY